MRGIAVSCLSSGLKGNRGSFTLEAIIAVPFFLLILMFLINLIAVSAVYVAMDHAVSETAKIIAGTALPLQDLKSTLPGLSTNTADGMGTEIINDILQKAAKRGTGIVLDSVGKEIVSKLIKEYYPLKKLEDEDFRLVEVRLLSEKISQEPGLSGMGLKPEDITIVVVYTVRMPLPFVNSREFTLSNIAVERAWTDG